MLYDGVIRGHFVSLRSITLDDAEFSYNLRRDPRFVSIMGQAAATLEDQKRFIEWQMKQPGDYYFVVLNRDGERIGLIGVYDIHHGQGEIGREINVGAPYETMESMILITDFCIDVLHLEMKTGVIYKCNRKQLSILKRIGVKPSAEIIRSGIPSYEIKMPFEEWRHHYDKARQMIEEIAKRGTN